MNDGSTSVAYGKLSHINGICSCDLKNASSKEVSWMRSETTSRSQGQVDLSQLVICQDNLD